MPKHVIEFQLPEEAEELKLAQAGPAMSAALYDFDEWLRTTVKHGDQLSEVQRAEREAVRQHLLRTLEDHEVPLW